MNGLKYVLFIKEYSLQEVANHLGVTAQGMASWSNGVKKIPPKRLEELSHFLGVEADLLQKTIQLEDRIQIERQLNATENVFEMDEELINYLQFQALQKECERLKAESLEKTATVRHLQEELEQLKGQVDRMIDQCRALTSSKV